MHCFGKYCIIDKRLIRLDYDQNILQSTSIKTSVRQFV